MILLAHRGVWSSKPQQNSLGAFRAAFDAGWGVELDVRDFVGGLVISHDPPLAGEPTFDAVLELAGRYAHPRWIAVNIKADGLAAAVAEALARHGIGHAFVFDMSVPDALHHLKRGTRTFTRHSEYETVPSFYDAAEGIWLDAFEAPMVAPDRLVEHLRAGKRVALVSPELHGKPYRDAWTAWKDALAGADLPPETAGRAMLCTDHPAEAEAFFGRAAA
jgi:hypothetical protein